MARAPTGAYLLAFILVLNCSFRSMCACVYKYVFRQADRQTDSQTARQFCKNLHYRCCHPPPSPAPFSRPPPTDSGHFPCRSKNLSSHRRNVRFPSLACPGGSKKVTECIPGPIYIPAGTCLRRDKTNGPVTHSSPIWAAAYRWIAAPAASHRSSPRCQ